MHRVLPTIIAASLALPFAWSCATDGQSGGAGEGPAMTSGGSTPAASTPSGSSTPTSGGSTGASSPDIPTLVNVNLQNVLNDLSVRLKIDRANVPINIQLPISLAANVCGVSVNVLAVSTGGQAQCTAKTANQELAQVVQQQMAAGGSVGGGAQGGSTAATGGTPSSGTATGGASGTGAPVETTTK